MLEIFVTTRRSILAVYYALIADAKVKACVSNFPLDVCWSTRAFRRGNLETPESRGYKCSSQNFIKDTAVSLYRVPRSSGAPCIFDTLMHSLYPQILS